VSILISLVLVFTTGFFFFSQNSANSSSAKVNSDNSNSLQNSTNSSNLTTNSQNNSNNSNQISTQNTNQNTNQNSDNSSQKSQNISQNSNSPILQNLQKDTKHEKSNITFLETNTANLKVKNNQTTTKTDELAPCQPTLFDPKTTKFTKENEVSNQGKDLYQVLPKLENGGNYTFGINGFSETNELKIANFEATNYEFGCASSFSSVLEIKQNSNREYLFTQIKNHISQSSISQDQKSLFLVNWKQNGKNWELLKRIINLETGKEFLLPNLDCIENLGSWNGQKLITYGRSEDTGIQNTKVCAWDNSGKLLQNMSIPLYWSSASANYLDNRIGLLKQNSDVFFVQTGGGSFRKVKIELTLHDLNSKNMIKFAAQELQDENANRIEFDTENINLNSVEAKYRNITFGEEGKIKSEWKIAKKL